MAAASEIKDATTARQFLEARGYCAKDQHIHVPLLATIALQLSLEKLDAQGAANAFRALSFLILNIDPTRERPNKENYRISIAEDR